MGRLGRHDDSGNIMGIGEDGKTLDQAMETADMARLPSPVVIHTRTQRAEQILLTAEL